MVHKVAEGVHEKHGGDSGYAITAKVEPDKFAVEFGANPTGLHAFVVSAHRAANWPERHPESFIAWGVFVLILILILRASGKGWRAMKAEVKERLSPLSAAPEELPSTPPSGRKDEA